MNKSTHERTQRTPELETFKYEVAQEIGISHRIHKNCAKSSKKS